MATCSFLSIIFISYFHCVSVYQIALQQTLREVVGRGVKMSIKVWQILCLSLSSKVLIPFNLFMLLFIHNYFLFWYFLFVIVNTKVDMRFNVKNAYWLSERVRDRILQMVSYSNSSSCVMYQRIYFLIILCERWYMILPPLQHRFYFGAHNRRYTQPYQVRKGVAQPERIMLKFSFLEYCRL